MAGCGPPSPPLLPYTIAPDGLAVVGTGLSVSFGRAEAGARAALVKLAGPERAEQAVPRCGRAVTYGDGLTAVFDGDRFVGVMNAQGRSAGRSCAG